MKDKFIKPLLTNINSKTPIELYIHKSDKSPEIIYPSKELLIGAISEEDTYDSYELVTAVPNVLKIYLNKEKEE